MSNEALSFEDVIAGGDIASHGLEALEQRSAAAVEALKRAERLSKTNGPELWAAVLAGVKKFCGPNAVVAGGAVRDYVLGVPPKDIDVFVQASALGCNLPGPEDGFIYVPTEGDMRKAEYEGVKSVQVVFFFKYGGLDLQIVAVEDPPGVAEGRSFGGALVDTFDLGITRIWSSSGPPAATEAFNQDLAASTVTRLLHDRPERSKARAERFIARHGDRFRYVIKE